MTEAVGGMTQVQAAAAAAAALAREEEALKTAKLKEELAKLVDELIVAEGGSALHCTVACWWSGASTFGGG